ncbi:MAG: type II toxin-antitoxin system RelE/ParE family toxin [Bacteroidetes bacterium]|nr:type II toxin-antitoxin system RelE/ParE family toxin [Bacteroidota bacterium]
MAYSIAIKKQAQQALWEAMDWYEAQSAGLGAALSQEFYDYLQKLTENPHRFMVVFDPFRRMLLKKFPYQVVFAIDEKRQRVVVMALWHDRRDPEALKKLLRK